MHPRKYAFQNTLVSTNSRPAPAGSSRLGSVASAKASEIGHLLRFPLILDATLSSARFSAFCVFYQEKEDLRMSINRSFKALLVVAIAAVGLSGEALGARRSRGSS